MIHFRVLNANDIAIYKEIRKKCLIEFPECFGTDILEEEGFAFPRINALLEKPLVNGFMYGTFNEDQLIGICGFIKEGRMKTRHRGEIIQVYLDAAYQGKGLAKKMLIKCLNTVFEDDEIELVTLSAVKSNQHATKLYESVGFREYGLLENYFKKEDKQWSQSFMSLKKSDHRFFQ